MKRVIIYSPDFSLCYSLLVYLQSYYKIVVTTDLEILNSFSFDNNNDAIFIDHELTHNIINIIENIKSKKSDIPIFLTYVYTNKVSKFEEKIKSLVNEIFYKPFDLNEISIKLTKSLNNKVYWD